MLFSNLLFLLMVVFNICSKGYILRDFICVYYQYLNGFLLHMLFFIACFFFFSFIVIVFEHLSGHSEYSALVLWFFLIFIFYFFNAILVCLHSFYVCMYVCMYGCVGSSFLCEGFL